MNIRVLRPQNSLLRMLGQIQLELRQRLERRGILAVSRDVFSRIPVKMPEISFVLLRTPKLIPFRGPLIGSRAGCKISSATGQSYEASAHGFFLLLVPFSTVRTPSTARNLDTRPCKTRQHQSLRPKTGLGHRSLKRASPIRSDAAS